MTCRKSADLNYARSIVELAVRNTNPNELSDGANTLLLHMRIVYIMSDGSGCRVLINSKMYFCSFELENPTIKFT